MTAVPVITKSDVPVIEIRISGIPGTGKSAIAQLIVKALHDSGAKDGSVFMRNEHDPLTLKTKATLGLMIDSIHARGTQFVVIEAMTSVDQQQACRNEAHANRVVIFDQER